MPVVGRVYVAAVVAAAAGFAAALATAGPLPGGLDLPLLAVLTLGAAAALHFPVMVSPRYKAEASFALYFPCVLLFPAPAVVGAVALSRLLGEGTLCLRRDPATKRRRRNLRSLAFNTAQAMLAAGLAALCYRSLLASPGLTPDLERVAAVFGAALVMYVVSSLLVVVAIAIQTAKSVFTVWSSIARVDLLQNGAMLMAGAMLAPLASGRPWMVGLLFLPAAAIQVSLKKTVVLMEQTVAAVEAMADLVDRRDPYTAEHSRNVASNSVVIARQLGLSELQVEAIRLAARVHDLGKIGVPDSILHKEGRLTDLEFELMKQHPAMGAEILAKYPEYKHGVELVLAHHERMDGLGYPHGLKGADIPLGARIIAVADSWDAMTTDRPYRRALTQEVALAELERGRGRQWDESVVDAFMDALLGRGQPRPRGWSRHVRQPAVRALGAAVGIFAA